MNKTQIKPKFNYGEALQKSNLFYKAQRSGDLPEDYTIPWRGDSALKDGADVGRDLTGGYYDAGDHVKFGFPGAASMTMLSWGVKEYRDGYEKIGQLDETLENIKWGTDYILKAYDDKGTATTKDDVFWGQVGSGQADHGYWGAPEDMTMDRPAFKVDAQNPGSDLTGESAAALASASIAFRGTDDNYADKLLEKAKQLYEFADQYQGAYTNAIQDASAFYNSWSGYKDELAWGAAWLHKAVKAAGETDTKYLDKAESYYNGINSGWTQSWDDKAYGTGILLAQETGKDKYKKDVESWLDNWADDNGSIKKTDGGLAWLDQWGSLRYAANTAFLAGIYGDTVNDKGGKYSGFSQKQINYILGDNPKNFSYMVGFGENSPKNPHHRAASGTTNIGDSNPNKYTLYGALVGGPSSANDDAYRDERTDYVANEVALDYNAGLTGALARMTKEFGGEALTKIPGVKLDGSSNPTDPVGGGGNPDGGGNPTDPVGGGGNPDGGGNSTDPVGGGGNPDGGGNPTDPVGGGGNPDGGGNPSNPMDGDVKFSVVSEWNDGFTGNIKLTNNSDKPMNGWELEFKAPFDIKNIWNGNIESHQGNKYVIKNADWNGTIAPGQSIEFGFNGTNSDSMQLELGNVELNGVATGGNPTDPVSGNNGNPTDPVGGNNGNPTDPVGGDNGNPTDPVGGGKSNPTDPVGSDNGNPTDPVGAGTGGRVDPITGVTDSKIQVGTEYNGEGTFYGATGAGHCSLDAAKPGEPLMFAAMNHEQYDNSEACGSYVEVSGPKQAEGADPIVVKIVDECPECKLGDLDLSPEAFEMIGDPIDGRIPISWHLVNPQKTDPITYHSKEGSTNEYWTAIQIRNSNAPISKLEMQEANGKWTELERKPYNFFVDSDGVGAGEHTFRITNTLGQTITETFEPAIGGQDVASQFQFPSDPFPTPTV